MKLYRQICILAFSAASAVSILAKANPAERRGELSGEVALVQAGAGASTKDASQVVVWLVPLNVVQQIRATERPRYRLLQHNKRFEPGLLVVPVGSVVDFPNADPWFHNVFSLYRGKRFDLGLYQARALRSVKFDRVGDVAPGKYVLHVWYENAAPEALEALARPVNIEAETRTLPLISIAVTKQTQTEHKNKYGQDYDPDTLKTDY